MIEQKQKSDEQILLLSNTLKSVNDIIAIADTDFKFLFVNDAFCKIYGYTQEELIGKFVGIVISKNNDVNINETANPAILADGWKGEQLSTTKDGKDVLVEMHISPVKNLKGEVIAAVTVANDITEKKKQEKELVDAKHRLEMLMTSSSTMIYSSEAFGDFDANYISGNFSSITGYPNDDFYKKGWWASKIHPDDSQKVFNNLEKLFKDGDHSFEYRFLFKNGSWHWMHDDLKLINNESGNPLEFIGTWQDITKQKLAEDALKKREHSFRTLSENLPASVYRLYLREGGKMEFFNDIIEHITGYTKDELRKGEICSIDPFIFSADKPHVLETVKNAIKNDCEFEVEYRFKRKFGQLSYFSEKGRPIMGDDGKPLYIEGVIFDITYRKNAEEALRKSEKRYREFADFLPQPVFEFDNDGKFTFANRSCMENTGYTIEEIQKGLTFFDLTDPSQHKNLTDMMKKRLKNIPTTGTEITIIRKDGTSFPAIGFTSPIEKNGEMRGLRGIIIDITERKKYEAILKQNAARFQMLNDIGGKIASSLELDIIMTQAVKLVYENFNYNHVSLLKYYGDENSVMFKATEGEFKNLFERDNKIYLEKGIVIWAAKTGGIAVANDVSIDPHYVNAYPDMINTRSELCIPLKIGTIVFGILDMQCAKLNAFSEEDINVLATLCDQIALAINNSLLYKSVQEELIKREKAEEELKLIILSKDKLFSIVAHDLKSPFLGLLGYSDYLVEEFDNINKEEMKEYIGKCKIIVKNLYRLIENLLEWARLQTGRVTLETIDIMLIENVIFVSDLLFENANMKNIKLINSVDPGLIVKSDEKMLNSILVNLISNSIKFTNPGGEIIISSNKTNGMAEVKISDNGIGINDEVKSRLFSIDSSNTSEGTAGEKGTGLGLLICKELVEIQSGKIWIESEEGKGSSFTFTIPLAE